MSSKYTNASIQSGLSIERTKLANRRTLLAYFRSAVALVVAGAGLMKFIQDDIWIYTGIACIFLAPVTVAIGIFDYYHVKSVVEKQSLLLSTSDDEEADE